MDKQLPFDLNAEVALLGSMMLSEEVLNGVEGKIKAEHFYHEKHKTIFAAMMNVKAQGEVDLITLSDYLNKNNQLNKAGGEEYLVTLMQSMPSSSQWEHYRKIVLSHAIKRAGIKVCAETQRKLFDGEDEVDILNNLNEIVERLLSATTDTVFCHHEEFKKLMEDLEAEKESAGEMMPVGLDFWDGYMPLRRGHLCFLTAIPGGGKTSMMFTLIGKILENKNRNTIAFVCESLWNEIIMRLVSVCADIEFSSLEQWSKLSHTKRERFNKVKDALYKRMEQSNLRIYAGDMFNHNMNSIRSLVYKYERECGRIDYVFIDHLHDLGSSIGDKAQSKEIIEDNVNKCHAIAQQFRCVTIVLAQFVKGAGRDGLPQLSDLFGSAKIEQKAHAIVCVHNQDKLLDVDVETRTFYRLKGRLCKDFITKLSFHGATMKFLGWFQEQTYKM